MHASSPLQGGMQMRVCVCVCVCMRVRRYPSLGFVVNSFTNSERAKLHLARLILKKVCACARVRVCVHQVVAHLVARSR